jgi:8-hydroxy-5-deazaflavin:NADPH oxidoreductase
VSTGSVIARLLPPGAHAVKAFAAVAAEKLADASNRSPDRAVLFYATDDATGGGRLIRHAAFGRITASTGRGSLRTSITGCI